jgi:3-deoxy-D-manno-octulosonic-acid transferase
MTAFKTESFFQLCVRSIYTLCLMLLLPLLLLLFRKKLSIDGHYKGKPRRFSERFGKVPGDMQRGGILVHCVSIGELNASVQLVKILQREYPNLAITISTTSTTGAQHAYNIYKDSVQHLFLPIDIPVFMRRFFDALAPRLVLITEVEIWPNMLHQCTKRNIPTALVNARLSDESLPSYQKLSALLRPALRQFDKICAQSQKAYDNFKCLGVYKHQLSLTLNMKFDLKPDTEDERKGAWLEEQYAFNNAPLWLAASTHEPEELFVLSVYQKLLKRHSELRLVVVPRHPHRFEDVYLMIKATGLSVSRLSERLVKENLESSEPCSAQVILVDQMAWLKAFYSICDAAFIGGSIAPKGGHNALECAMYGKPMVMGTSTFNNPIIVQMLQDDKALDIIKDEKECEDRLITLLSIPERAVEKGAAGKQVLENNRGAVALTYEQINKLL